MKINYSRVFRRLAEQHGSAPALINCERNRQFSFSDLHQLSNRIANFINGELGLVKDERYLLILENDNLSLMHLWTILKCAASAVFTNVRDPVEEHLRIARFVNAKAVFIEGSMVELYAPAYQALGIPIVVVDPPSATIPGLIDFWERVNASSDADPDLEIEFRTHYPLLRFTGGTTGIPKCAAYSAENLSYMAESFNAIEDKLFHRDTRVLHFAPLSHGTNMLLMPTFLAGGCNLTQNQPDIELWRTMVERHRVTTSFLVPTLLYRLATLQLQQPRNLASLQTLVYGAAPMSPDKLIELQQAFGNIFVQAYASTESPCVVAALPRRLHRGDSESDRKRLGAAGLPTPGVEIRIVDGEGRDVTCGEAGELWIRHRGIISGYHNNPQQTVEEFTDGWWKSGDIGRIDEEGLLYLVDRKKDMIITGGFNVYASEVETALNSHPAVMMAAVVGIPSPEWGEAVLAEVIRRPNESISEQALIEHVKQAIGAIKTPKRIVFVDQLPLSAVGKVLRRKVHEKYWSDQARGIG